MRYFWINSIEEVPSDMQAIYIDTINYFFLVIVRICVDDNWKVKESYYRQKGLSGNKCNLKLNNMSIIYIITDTISNYEIVTEETDVIKKH